MNVSRSRVTSLLGRTIAAALIGWMAGAPAWAQVGGPNRRSKSDSGAAYRVVDRLDAGLPELLPPPDLETPQACLENFILSAERGDFTRAAYSLDLNAIPAARQAGEGPRLARQLKVVMDQQVWFKWGDIPDRPDGQNDNPSLREQAGGPSGPQDNIRLYTLHDGDRDFEIRLARLKVGDSAPAWVFSRQTVEHVPTLYAIFGPSRLERAVPAVLKTTRVAKVALWQWIGFAVFLLAGGALAWLVRRGVDLILKRHDAPWSRSLAEAIRGPGSLTVGLWTFYALVRSRLGLAGPILSVLEPVYIAVLVVVLVWFLQRLIGYVSIRICRNYEACASDAGNQILTRIAVARHLLTFAVIVGGAINALSRFEWFQQVGVTLLASAGVAGVILGIAAQRMLGNLFAGLLLAVTQPVKSGDAIIFEGEFGWIEEIAITYLVIRLWDLRRIVVPLTYFLDKPFQNWSRRGQQLMLPVYIHADYRVDVSALRAELKAILEESEYWDKTVPPILQVTDCQAETVVLRALCSARDPGATWNLQCHVRERLLSSLREQEGGRYLPRRRVALVEGREAAPEDPGRVQRHDGLAVGGRPEDRNGHGERET